MSTTPTTRLSAVLRRARRVGLSRQGQRDFETRTSAGVVHRANITAMQAGGRAANCKSKPHTDDVAFRAPALKLVEQALRVAFGEAGSIVGDRQCNAFIERDSTDRDGRSG